MNKKILALLAVICLGSAHNLFSVGEAEASLLVSMGPNGEAAADAITTFNEAIKENSIEEAKEALVDYKVNVNKVFPNVSDKTAAQFRSLAPKMRRMIGTDSYLSK